MHFVKALSSQLQFTHQIRSFQISFSEAVTVTRLLKQPFILKNLKTSCKITPTISLKSSQRTEAPSSASVIQHHSERQSNFPKEYLFSVSNFRVCSSFDSAAVSKNLAQTSRIFSTVLILGVESYIAENSTLRFTTVDFFTSQEKGSTLLQAYYPVRKQQLSLTSYLCPKQLGDTC